MIDEGFNIHEINRGLRELEATGGAAALELKQVRVKQAHARKALRDAKAHAVFGAPAGTVQLKSAYVDEQTTDLQLGLDLADVEVKYAADMVDERSSTRSSLQTRAKLALESLRLAGYAGGA